MDSTVKYLESQEFVSKGFGIVRFGTAPDGLPFLAGVPEPASANDLLESAARAMGVERTMTSYENTPLEPIVKELDRALRESRIRRLPDTEGRLTEVLILPTLLRTLVGSSLMERLLTEGTELYRRRAADVFDLMSEGETTASSIPIAIDVGDETTSATPATGALPSEGAASAEGEGASPAELKPGDACLALPVEGGKPIVVHKTASASGWPEFSYKRTYEDESTALVKEAWYEATFLEGLEYGTERVSSTDLESYRTLRADAAQSRWKWVVPRAAAAGLVLELARSLVRLHDAGAVHGDVKPINTVVTRTGVEPIDGLGLCEGMRSPAVTRGWAAPE